MYTMPSRVAVVTGANKGTGLDIVRGLCRHFGQDGVVYLTARNEGRGRAAVELLQKEGLDPKFYLLDVTDQSTIDKLRTHLEKEHGGIDVLVNNAGIDPHDNPLEHGIAVLIVLTNFFGVREVCRSLTPLLRSGGRIVNVTSWSFYQPLRDEPFRDGDVRQKFRQVKDEQGVVDLMKEFLEEFKAGTHVGYGWTDSASGVSKLGMILLSKLQAETISRDTSREDILVNACCPGLHMSAHMQAPRVPYRTSAPEGADTPVFLALLPPGTKEPNGQFLMRRKAWDLMNTDVYIPLIW